MNTAARIARAWTALYTRGLPPEKAERRRKEIESDLHEHAAHSQKGSFRTQAAIVSRTVRGVPADLIWRDRSEVVSPRAARNAYRAATGIAVWSLLLLVWAIGALGVIGSEGNPADRMYALVVAIAFLGSIVVRFKPAGMARVLLAMALTLGVIAAVALAAGEQDSGGTSVLEIVGLNLFFAAQFGAASWLFRRASRRSKPM